MIPGSANPLLLASAAGSPAPSYQIERSLRFNSSDSAFCSRVFSSAGNRKTFTYSAWVKRNKLGVYGRLLAAGTGTNDATYFALNFRNSDIISVEGVSASWRLTTQVFRDPGAWMHVLLAIDTTLAVAGDRIKLYVNGSQITTFSASNDPTLNYDFVVNSNVEHMLGADKYNNSYSYYSDFQLADIHFIDGQALDPTSFGEFDASGVWQPKAYTGTYPGNSFHLPFSDNSTAAALGTDTSGNSNNWTVNNISVAAGAGNDSLVDTPTSYGTDDGLGGSVRGNYATLNPLDGGPSGLSNGNLDAASANAYPTIIPGSGQWYYEVNGTGYQWDGIRANWTPRAGSHNFGQRAWASSAPSGFKALCTTNLPEPQTITTSGSYTGNGLADGPFVYLNGVPTAMTVNGTAVTFGTHADKLSNGFKLRTNSATYNQNAATYNYSVTSTGPTFKTARAQSN